LAALGEELLFYLWIEPVVNDSGEVAVAGTEVGEFGFFPASISLMILERARRPDFDWCLSRRR
jgi:hypothetical protein